MVKPQHFEFIFDTMQEKERYILKDILKKKTFDPDSAEIEKLEHKGYVIREKDDSARLFCSKFERFISQYVQ